jgi:hypothetical protein
VTIAGPVEITAGGRPAVGTHTWKIFNTDTPSGQSLDSADLAEAVRQLGVTPDRAATETATDVAPVKWAKKKGTDLELLASFNSIRKLSNRAKTLEKDAQLDKEQTLSLVDDFVVVLGRYPDSRERNTALAKCEGLIRDLDDPETLAEDRKTPAEVLAAVRAATKSYVSVPLPPWDLQKESDLDKALREIPKDKGPGGNAVGLEETRSFYRQAYRRQSTPQNGEWFLRSLIKRGQRYFEYKLEARPFPHQVRRHLVETIQRDLAMGTASTYAPLLPFSDDTRATLLKRLQEPGWMMQAGDGLFIKLVAAVFELPLTVLGPDFPLSVGPEGPLEDPVAHVGQSPLGLELVDIPKKRLMRPDAIWRRCQTAVAHGIGASPNSGQPVESGNVVAVDDPAAGVDKGFLFVEIVPGVVRIVVLGPIDSGRLGRGIESMLTRFAPRPQAVVLTTDELSLEAAAQIQRVANAQPELTFIVPAEGLSSSRDALYTGTPERPGKWWRYSANDLPSIVAEGRLGTDTARWLRPQGQMNRVDALSNLMERVAHRMQSALRDDFAERLEVYWSRWRDRELVGQDEELPAFLELYASASLFTSRTPRVEITSDIAKVASQAMKGLKLAYARNSVNDRRYAYLREWRRYLDVANGGDQFFRAFIAGFGAQIAEVHRGPMTPLRMRRILARSLELRFEKADSSDEIVWRRQQTPAEIVSREQQRRALREWLTTPGEWEQSIWVTIAALTAEVFRVQLIVRAGNVVHEFGVPATPAMGHLLLTEDNTFRCAIPDRLASVEALRNGDLEPQPARLADGRARDMFDRQVLTRGALNDASNIGNALDVPEPSAQAKRVAVELATATDDQFRAWIDLADAKYRESKRIYDRRLLPPLTRGQAALRMLAAEFAPLRTAIFYQNRSTFNRNEMLVLPLVQMVLDSAATTVTAQHVEALEGAATQLIANGVEVTPQHLRYVASGGPQTAQLIGYLTSQGVSVTPQHLEYAASGVPITAELIDYLTSQGVSVTRQHLRWAASGVPVSATLIDYLTSEGAKVTARNLRYAAQNIELDQGVSERIDRMLESRPDRLHPLWKRRIEMRQLVSQLNNEYVLAFPATKAHLEALDEMAQETHRSRRRDNPAYEPEEPLSAAGLGLLRQPPVKTTSGWYFPEFFALPAELQSANAIPLFTSEGAGSGFSYKSIAVHVSGDEIRYAGFSWTPQYFAKEIGKVLENDGKTVIILVACEGMNVAPGLRDALETWVIAAGGIVSSTATSGVVSTKVTATAAGKLKAQGDAWYLLYRGSGGAKLGGPLLSTALGELRAKPDRTAPAGYENEPVIVWHLGGSQETLLPGAYSEESAHTGQPSPTEFTTPELTVPGLLIKGNRTPATEEPESTGADGGSFFKPFPARLNR